MYSETIAGVTILRVFGASSRFLQDLLRYFDSNCNPSYFLLSSIITAIMALLAVLDKDISAPLPGFALAFGNTITYDLLLLGRVVLEFVSLEQAMVQTFVKEEFYPGILLAQLGLERVKEYSEPSQETPEFIEPRPEPSLTFEVKPGAKIGILGLILSLYTRTSMERTTSSQTITVVA
ncbi:hypothetical protein B0H13DRAFT_2319292 [Mycena leptocephala]|nr:hypothetical protein B0H13DRAFT_2319292 [Mycena leptocephala]